MGPTAAGKSEFAIELAHKIPVEIISVDSAMVYRGMNIGTGKPSVGEMQGIPHHLIDIRDPVETYSAAEFAKSATQLITEITERGRIPLLVGGTMLYFRALQQGLSHLPSANAETRANLLEEAQKIGWDAMHQRLSRIDPESAARIHPNDPQRIQRALEVYTITGQPISTLFGVQKTEAARKNYEIHAFALAPNERALLHQKIEQRLHQMLALGLVAEVEVLFKRGDLNSNMPSIRAVGYRQVWKYLEGGCTFDEMAYKVIVATRQLAKRQLTWLRSLSDITWLSNTRLASLSAVIHSLS
ncbi:MAG TPA: tRNA (adenosine(37)-N6)-dimethylallyltransferase MiaA [Gammaproteobacteria bacterium]|nr:tRNA (adenosine(37)-N6)-dimethylallyltransferase MiaA [Gammaproteobacteria bacterium]